MVVYVCIYSVYVCGKKHSEEEASVLEEGHSFGSTYELTDSLALVICLFVWFSRMIGGHQVCIANSERENRTTNRCYLLSVGTMQAVCVCT